MEIGESIPFLCKNKKYEVVKIDCLCGFCV
jgi:hypothetical protein